MIDAAAFLLEINAVNKKPVKYETGEPSSATKRAMRDAIAGRGFTRIGSTKEEIHEWTRRMYERAYKKSKV